ncbi:MAG: glutamine synthetase family protein, partial [Defluviitaleaceae bacterium]|nr:glutamine synthetase family protein [Defluviitaleaceae bacterium]
TLLPWRPGPGRTARFFCDIKNPDGTPFALDGRGILKKVIAEYAKMGLVCTVGAECEFYLFKTDEDGSPTFNPADKGGYLDIAPLDKSEDIRREICLVIEEMGIKPETSHHEQGPGQNEIDFKFSDALTCADNFLAFKTTVRKIATRNGLFASFLPKPIADNPGSGLHVNLSLSDGGKNIFTNSIGEFTDDAKHFIAGILSKTPEITLFLNPTANSYDRFGKFEAPKYVSWSHQNRSQLIRIPAAKGEKVRMELRSPDPSLNPYLAFALILAAGLDGIKRKTPLPQAVDADLYDLKSNANIISTLKALPNNLQEAITQAKNSSLIKHTLGNELLTKYTSMKESETDFTKEDYFETV